MAREKKPSPDFLCRLPLLTQKSFGFTVLIQFISFRPSWCRAASSACSSFPSSVFGTLVASRTSRPANTSSQQNYRDQRHIPSRGALGMLLVLLVLLLRGRLLQNERQSYTQFCGTAVCALRLQDRSYAGVNHSRAGGGILVRISWPRPCCRRCMRSQLTARQKKKKGGG